MTEHHGVHDGQRTTVTRKEADEIMERLARRFAEGASGMVTLFAHDVLTTSVFLQRDLPAIRANPNVTAIKIVDPVTHEERVLQRGEF
jgi:hypothetical protein